MVGTAFDMSFLELDIVGDVLGLNVRPFPFTSLFPVHGASIEDRQRLVKSVAASMAAKGLLDDDQFAPVVEQLIGMFAGGRLSVAMVGSAQSRSSYCVRAAVEGSTGVIARHGGSAVRFTPIAPTSMAHSLVGMLVPMKAGPGSSVTITVPPGSRPQSGSAAPDDFASVSYLSSGRSAGGESRARAERIVQRPRLGSGYFAVATVGRNGRESAPQTVTWLDTDLGRYVILVSTRRDGGMDVTYLPADRAKVEQSLSRLLADAAPNG